MSLIRQRLVFASVTVACVVALAIAGWAHAILMESTPKPNGSIKGPNFEVTLRFNVRIDAARSRVQIEGPENSMTTLTIGKQPSPEVLKGSVKGLKPGDYKLKWQVLASDGHMSQGVVPFVVL